jgi:hypothetical protein
MAHPARRTLALERADPKCQKGILQDLEEPSDRLLRDLAVAGELRVVDPVAARGRGDIEKSRVGTDVSDQGLRLNLLAEVHGRVRVEHVLSRDRIQIDTRETADLQGTLQVERFADLPDRERVQVLENDAARQEVRPAALELARAGPREDEAMPCILVEQRLDRVEERWEALDLVDDDERRLAQRQDLSLQPRRFPGVRDVGRLVREVDHHIWPERARQRGLSDLARPEEEDALRAHGETALERSTYHMGQLPSI